MPTKRPTTTEPPSPQSPGTTSPTPNTTPERRQQPRLRPLQPTTSNSTIPAESVRVTDRPATEGGRAYLVERELETKSELDALIADYVQQATNLDRPPLAVSPLENDLEGDA